VKRKTWIIFTVLAVIVVSLAWVRGPVVAQNRGPTMQVGAGFDGYCRNWCPVYTVLSNEGVDVEGELRVAVRGAAGVSEPNVYVKPVVLPAHSRKAYFLYLPLAGASSRSHLTVQFLTGDEVLASEQVAVARLDEGDRLYGVASGSPSALNFLSDVTPTGGKAAVAHLDLELLPPDPLTWEGLDVLILNDVDTAALSGERRQALETWVAQGGHLIVGGGAGAARTVAGVAGLLPVTVGGTRSVDDLWALGERWGAPVTAGPYAVTQASLREGEVLIEQRDEQGELVLLARRSHGAGMVDFLAFDAGLNPFTRWNDNARLWGFVIGVRGAGTRWLSVRNGDSAHEAVNAIPNLELPSLLQILAFMLVYTLLVGPVNYVVLRKLDRRELAWLTIPALVVGFTVCAYVTGFQVRGSVAIVHRLAAVYVPQGASVGRVSQVVGLFSPRRADYDVWVAGAGVREVPGDVYGGPVRQPLHVVGEAEGSTVADLRVDVGGIQPFVVEGYADVPAVEADLRLSVDTAGLLRLEGTVRNGDVPLEDAVLIVGGDERRLDDLEAGEEAHVHLSLHSGGGMGAPGPGSSVPYGYNIPERILGPGNYWEDRELYRRYQFIQALFPYEGPGLGLGVYLIGWAEKRAPLPVEVLGRPFSAVETALYVYDLPVAGLETGTAITVPPGLITRQVEETTGYVDVWPEGLHMEPGAEIVFSFTVWPGVRVGQVDELVLVLDMQRGSYTGMSYPPIVSLWNRGSGDWDRVDVGWGEHTIPNAGVYVAPPGDVLLRLEAGPEWSADVMNLTITIKGQQ
jgi:hypothetical protein